MTKTDAGFMKLVNDLACGPRDLSPEQFNLLHSALGFVGEAAEAADWVKKHVVYGQPLNRVELIKEMGDAEFYFAMMRRELGIEREEVLAVVQEKLAARYPAGTFTQKDSVERKDEDA